MKVITFADTKFITKVILLSVKLALQPRATLDTIHTGDGAVASLPQRGRAHPAAAAVIQHRPLTAQGAFARIALTGLGAIYCIFRTPSGSSVHGRQQECEQQEDLHVLRGSMLGPKEQVLVFSPVPGAEGSSSTESKAVAAHISLQVYELYTACCPHAAPSSASSIRQCCSCQPPLFQFMKSRMKVGLALCCHPGIEKPELM